MKEPIKWFTEALDSGKYEKDVISEIISCISDNSFDSRKFMEWVSEQVKKE